MKEIRFGIIGCGTIAPKFINSTKSVEGCSVVAVCARDKNRAQRFADEHCPGAKVYDSYDEICSDDGIDAVYIATPHAYHAEHAKIAFRHKKHVLCEKIMTTDMERLNSMFDEAQKADVLLMEALWTRFLPVITDVKKVIEGGELGEITDIEYSLGFDATARPDSSRINSPELAGGAIFDLGVYLINSALSFTEQTPVLTNCKMIPSRTGVDATSEFVLKFDGFNARLRCSIIEEMDGVIRITTKNGSIAIPVGFGPNEYVIQKGNDKVEYKHEEADFSYEIRHFCELLRHGKIDSDVFGRKQSTEFMRIVDEFRENVGLRYPFDYNIEEKR